METIDLAVENKIYIICLPSYTTHLLQPLDVGIFKSVKKEWKEITATYYRLKKFKIIDKKYFSSS